VFPSSRISRGEIADIHVQIHINDNFAKFSEALYVADRHAREEVRQRTLMQQKLAEKEKASKEENLRLLAQRAREGRTGVASSSNAKPTAAANAAFKSSLGQYGDSDSEEGSDASGSRSASEKEDSGDDEAARIRDQMRKEKRQEREREMRMSHMGTEQRMKQLARYVYLSSGIKAR
jgi:SNW domain-containing protein 1